MKQLLITVQDILQQSHIINASKIESVIYQPDSNTYRIKMPSDNKEHVSSIEISTTDYNELFELLTKKL